MTALEVRADEPGTDHRPDVYYEGDLRVFRASAFGSCESALVRNAVGHTAAPPPAWMLEKFEESAGFEQPILDELAHHGWRMMADAELQRGWGTLSERTGQLEVELKVPGGVIRCHPDGVAHCFKASLDNRKMLGEDRVVEVKALRRGTAPFKNPNYPWQLSIEMLGTGLPGMFVVGWKEDGELVRRDDGSLDLTIAYYDKPPHSLGQIKARAAKLNRLIRAAEEGDGLPACDIKMFPCGFWADHDTENGVWKKEEVPEVDGLAELLEDYQEATTDLERAKERVDFIKADVKDLLVQRGLEAGKYRGGEYEVTRVVKAGNIKINRDKAKAAGVDLTPFEERGKGSDYVTIKAVE